MARIYVWLRYSASRQLTWQRNYNTQPRILGEAQARLTGAIAAVRNPVIASRLSGNLHPSPACMCEVPMELQTCREGPSNCTVGLHAAVCTQKGSKRCLGRVTLDVLSAVVLPCACRRRMPRRGARRRSGCEPCWAPSDAAATRRCATHPCMIASSS